MPAAADQLSPPPDGHALDVGPQTDENGIIGSVGTSKTNGHVSFASDVEYGDVANRDVEGDAQTSPPRGSLETGANGVGHVAETNGADSQKAQDVGDNNKKRKFDRIAHELTRKVSPPWKKVAAEGPTSFVIDGRRKSSRTNTLPMEMQPPSEKRTTRAKQSVSGKRQLNGSNGVRTGNGTSPSLTRRDVPARKSMTDERPSTRESQRIKRASLPASNSKALPKSRVAATPVRPSRSSRQSLSTAEETRKRVSTTPLSARSSRTSRNLRELPSTPSNVKLRIRIGSPTLQQNPKHFPRGKTHDDFSAWLASDNPLSEESLPPSMEQTQQQTPQLSNMARREALARLRLVRAAEPGGPLADGNCTAFYALSQPEPRPRWGNWDFIAAHASNMHSLMKAELGKHRKNAALLARACAAEIYSPGPSIAGGVPARPRWAFLQEAKSAEEIWEEERGYQLRRYKQLVKDVEAKWRMALAEVDKIREAAWEKEQELQGNRVLDDLLGKSTMLLQRQFGDGTTTPGSNSRRGSVVAFESTADSTLGSDEGESSSESEEDDSNMSESDDEEEEQEGLEDPDAGLTQEELLAKYASLPDIQPESSDEEEDEDNESQSEDEIGMDVDGSIMMSELLNNTDTRDHTPTPTPDPELAEEYGDVVIDDVDPILMDDEDEDTSGMSEEDLSDDGSIDEGNDDEDDEEDEDQSGMYLAALFSKSELEKFKAQQEAEIKVEDNEEEEIVKDAEEVVEEPIAELENNVEGEPTKPIVEDTLMEEAESPAVTDEPAISSSTAQPSHDTLAESTRSTSLAVTTNADTRVPVPHLLRGTLREYQHDGLDWLAKLYVGNRNGILADEMGLGKTIQTIALLAHLATEHHVWGPHLIVVPTSVILNWEMEFKKWCPGFKILTYYGSIEERRAKRKGWTNDDLWNVCITSYQLIIQDAQAFKKRAWHYLVLDEAHNIKNFQSLRWQTLLTFKTHSRLLLTGTPLQNNLQELWSLLYFLMPAGTDGAGGFADLEKFLNSMKRPADQILDQGLQQLDPEAQARVDKLHEILRPFLLRRLKSQVEKQMPSKYEHVVYCRLSKRQRQLYDGFMGRTDTKRTLSSGNYMSIINVLMSLRKVCNHPDLFETRQIVTSFAMQKSVAARFEPVEMMLRKMLQLPADRLEDQVNLEYAGFIPVSNEGQKRKAIRRFTKINAVASLEAMAKRELDRLNKLLSESGNSILAEIAIEAQKNVVSELHNRVAHVRRSLQRTPIYGRDLVDLLTMPQGSKRFDPPKPTKKKLAQTASFGDWYLDKCVTLEKMLPTVEDQANMLVPLVTKFGCVTPAVVAEDVTSLSLTRQGVEIVQLAQEAYPLRDPYHEARIRLSIAFPDKRLLQYDCGKLQALDRLLRDLQAGGHRCLIFTQMTKVLDILEQFLNIHGHRYLRLDGATKIEQRQILTDRFNNDDRILAFILSSRSGGLGINLTGADTVIFYDLDWNPAMDKQCQDRCHRIGQTRDVHIYRFVSEHTIEANILRKSNQKRLLDDVIIQRGEFTTDVFQERVTYRDALGDLMDPSTADGTDEGKAMDKVLGDIAGLNKVLDVVEDTEDVTAAKAAQKEVVADDADFKEIKSAGPTTGAATTPAAEVPPEIEEMVGPEGELPHVDEYLVRYLKDYEFKDVPFRPPIVKAKIKKAGVEMKKRRR